MGTSCALRTPFSCTILLLVGKNSLYNLPKVLTTVSRKYPLFSFRAVPVAELSKMSSQDSKGESYIADYIANPKVYGDVEHYGWTTEEEEDYDAKRKEETSSDEEDDLLPQPGDMHVEFKKSSLPKVQSIPLHFLQDNKAALCKKIMKLQLENEDLREENFSLRRKLEKKSASTLPTSSPSKK